MSAMTDKKLILSIDNGTQSIRALLFDLKGKLVAKSQIELEAYFSKQPGWAEQHPEYFWQNLTTVCQNLWLQDSKLKQRVIAVALTTQRGTTICLDEHQKPLRPAIIWLDQRLAAIEKPMPMHFRLVFKALRQTQTIDYFRQKAQANWIAQNEPEIWQKTDKFVLLSGYLTHKLTGEMKDSKACTVGYLPFDYKRQQWAAKSDWKWAALPLKKQQLSTLVEPGQPLGKITEQASIATGIPVGLPLIAAASDKACEVLGSGCHEPSTASLSYGTTATVNTNNSKHVEPQPFIPPYPSAIPKQYNCEAMIYRGFWMVSWFKQEFGLRERIRAKELGVSAESLFDELVNKVPPGSMGLMLQPYWSPSIKNLEAKGAILGFGDVHTRAHIYRAILEGLAYALKEGLQTIEKRQKQKVTRLIISGGGSQSDAVMQLSADIFNLPAQRPHTYETSGLGAAINAAVGMGEFTDYDQACKAMTHIEKIFQPNSGNVAMYEQLYKHVYLKLYKKLKPIYHKIRNITGYPE